MKSLEPNTHLQERYVISRLIGKGGMGEVYLAIDKRLGHSVAIKRTTVGDDEVLAEAFEQEGRTLAGLRHPVLPKVSDHFIENTEQYLVMDYIEGEDLAERMKTMAKPFPLEWVMFWSDQLLEALGYLHKHDPPIIHRDIKPQNLKLTAENQIILLDFGLSKKSLGKTQVTSSGSVVGYTPHYAPMEQISGTGTNARSDIYSLSATLFQLLTMAIPPDALSRADVLLAGGEDPVRPLPELNDEVSEPISDIILKGMSLSQEKRYASAREMQKDFRNAFNTLRASMSAETVAFNVEDEGVSFDGAKTEVIPDFQPADIAVPPSQDSPDDEPEQPAAVETGDISFDKTEVIDKSSVQDIAAHDEYGSAADMDSSPGGAEPKPADIETEEFKTADFEEAPAAESFKTQEDIGDQFEAGEDISAADDFSTSEDIGSGMIPDATVPLISLGEDAADGDAGLPVAADSGPDGEAGSEDTAAAAATSGGKSSAGKYVAILGGLGIFLFVLIGSALAITWYVTNGGFGMGGDNSNVNATPEASPEPTPVEEPTPDTSNTEVLDDANSNSNTDVNSNTNVEITPDTRETPPTQTSNTPAAKPTRRPTAAPTRRPVSKPTPQPTKKPKTKDPGILQ